MKNNRLRILVLLLVCFVLGACLFTSCGKPKTFTVFYDTMGGSDVPSASVTEGESPSAPTDPIRFGFVFRGWFADAAATVPASPASTPVTGDVTYYAGWTPANAVQVKLDTKGGSAVPAVGVILGNTLTEDAIGVPTKEGYTFTGWYKNAACTARYTFPAIPTENITLYAGWKLNDGMGEYIGIVNGEEVARSVFPAGSPVLPTTQNGVSYLWFTDALLDTLFDPSTVSAGSVTLYGVAYTEGLEITDGVVTGYHGSVRDVIVPERWEGKTVTAVAENAFRGNTTVRHLTLPATVHTVGASAFYECTSLSSVNLTAACRTVGAYAFYGCEKLSEVGTLTGLSEIREHTFLGCRRLSSVTFADNLLAVGKYAFANCSALDAVMLPDTVTEIGEYAFAGCSSVRQFRIPAALNDLRTGALKDCLALTSLIPSAQNATALFRVVDGNLYGAYGRCLVLYVQGDKTETSFTLPAVCMEIAPYAFSGNANLTELSLADSGITLRRGALSGMQSLKTLTVPSLGEGGYLSYFFGAESGAANGSAGNFTPATLRKVTVLNVGADLADYAFYGFTGLSEIVGIGNLRSVGKYAFAYTALTEITIPASLVRIGDSAFYGCSAIRSFVVAAGNTSYSAYDGCLYSADGTTLYLVPQTKESVTFAPTVRTIAAGAFYKSRVLTLVVPSTVRTIESGAFAGVLRLRELTVPFIGGSADDPDTDYMMYIFGGRVSKSDSLQPDGTYSYSIGNTSCTPATLKKLTISGTITTIPEFAFAYLTEVTEILWQGDVTRIDDYAFCRTGLEKLTVPGTVTAIGDYAFASMDALKEATIPGSVGGNLGVAIFAGCSALERVTFEEGVTRIPALAFFPSGSRDSETGETNYFSALEYISLPRSLESIGESAFAYVGTRYIGTVGSTYSNLVFLLPADSHLKVIEKTAFYRSSVKSLVLPACFEEVGEMAFYGCENLASITFGNATDGSALRKLGGASFVNCKGLRTMTIWKEITSPADVPVMEYYTVSTTTENTSYNVFAGAAVPTIYVRSAGTYRTAEHWDEYDKNIFEITNS